MQIIEKYVGNSMIYINLLWVIALEGRRTYRKMYKHSTACVELINE
jgi:hypothetical protein